MFTGYYGKTCARWFWIEFVAGHAERRRCRGSDGADGLFFPKQEDDQVRQVVFIGAGSGITPLFSISKSVLMVEPESEVVLIYGSRTESSIIYKDKINALQDKYKERFKVIYTLSQPEETGRVSVDDLIKVTFLKSWKACRI